MAKALLPSQCDILHQYFEPSECCICKANQRIKELEQELSLICQHLKPPEDKVKAVKKILKQLLSKVCISTSDDSSVVGHSATQICQLFKIKLPENPYYVRYPTFNKRSSKEVAFNEALQQVKELNPDMEVEE